MQRTNGCWCEQVKHHLARDEHLVVEPVNRAVKVLVKLPLDSSEQVLPGPGGHDALLPSPTKHATRSRCRFQSSHWDRGTSFTELGIVVMASSDVIAWTTRRKQDASALPVCEQCGSNARRR